ncbi:MAG: NUDIX hydrolase N-terminal domain-containing protein [Acidimicrobiales bacterium]|nr:NUDIX hydrolase N-terminal domain-containing protein [Acidimicrobiales bacterium]
MAGRQVTDIDLVRWSEALAGIARTGLAFTKNLYEQERFEEILKIAADIRVSAGHDEDAYDENTLISGWIDSVGNGVAGYVTPKVAVGAIVGNDTEELLLIQRGDSGVWLYPTGWADIGYSPAEVVVKEVQEEAGIVAEPLRLVAVFDGLRLGARGLPFYSLVFHCRAVGGELRGHPLETRGVGWFRQDSLPEPLAGGGHWRDLAFQAIQGKPIDVVFDSPRSSIWRS